MSEILKQTFTAFAEFGSSKALSNVSSTLTSQKFAKLCKDTKIHGDNISSTDTDIIFNKVALSGQKSYLYDFR